MHFPEAAAKKGDLLLQWTGFCRVQGGPEMSSTLSQVQVTVMISSSANNPRTRRFSTFLGQPDGFEGTLTFVA